MISVDDFIEVKECIYKDEIYLVRDNGAIMRHSREGKRARKYDNKWTFGLKNRHTGYIEISGERVHRIVACAFHGYPPGDEYVVDHIDTNRCNNRPENLRWLTRLENALNNEITRSKIIMICGSIEAFIENPSILRGHENVNKNFEWMRNVTSEEAKISYERFKRWAEERPKPKGKQIDEWIYKESKPNLRQYKTIDKPTYVEKYEYDNVNVESKQKSLTFNAIQVNWRVLSEFPLCPQNVTEKPICDYQLNLIKDSVFCQNNTYQSMVVDSVVMDNENSLIVLTHSVHKLPKPWAIAKITYADGFYIHNNLGSYFKEEGAMKQFTLIQGKEWTGGDSIDDYC